MSFLRSSPALPRNTVLRLSPWLIVGSAVILGLAIAFWAVKNARQERDNMTRNLLDRSGALIWALEGGVRAGMGMRISAAHLQFMLEETAKQPGIAYMAVVTQQGVILAHSDRARIGEEMYSPEAMEALSPTALPRWRTFVAENAEEIFEVRKIFSPLPGFREHMRSVGFREHMRHSGFRDRMRNDCFGEDPRRGEGESGRTGHPLPAPPVSSNSTALQADSRDNACPGMASPPQKEKKGDAIGSPGASCSSDDRKDLVILVGLEMKSFEASLASDLRNTIVTAMLVGLLGVGGFISLFWAQSYELSRRLLRDTRAFAAEVVSSRPLGLLILDASGRISQSNPVAERILGRSGGELLGKSLNELDGADWEAIAARVRQSPVLEEEHLLFSSRSSESAVGKGLPVSVSASRILNDEGTDLGMIFLLRDLREVKRLQEQLRRSERLSTLGNMAARVAHEIRNPLSSIKGFATYLSGRHDTPEDREAARAMIGEVDRLNRVVSELLDFARPSNLRIAPADLDDILRRALRLVEPDAAAKKIALRFPAEDAQNAAPAGILVEVDAERITQALLNLFLNAVQATDPGGSISVTVTPPKDGRVTVVIADTGRGMPPEVLAQIFSPYFTTKASGTGLGLSIVHKIVEDHNGDIKVTSVEGQGSTVTIWLPLAEQAV